MNSKKKKQPSGNVTGDVTDLFEDIPELADVDLISQKVEREQQRLRELRDKERQFERKKLQKRKPTRPKGGRSRRVVVDF
ncbi:MAG: hypothetical protein Kow0069_14380 [Promethearchaeota archaeon]